MKLLNNDINQPNRLAIEMFQKFARFEYALKATGFCRVLEPRNGVIRAEPDWVAFASCIADSFDSPQNTKLGAAVSYLLNEPPKQQIIESDGSLRWHDSVKTGQSRAAIVLLYICQVRNNLFHGGKLDHDGNWFPEYARRSELLVKHSLTILDWCLEACPKVKKAFA